MSNINQAFIRAYSKNKSSRSVDTNVPEHDELSATASGQLWRRDESQPVAPPQMVDLWTTSYSTIVNSPYDASPSVESARVDVRHDPARTPVADQPMPAPHLPRSKAPTAPSASSASSASPASSTSSFGQQPAGQPERKTLSSYLNQARSESPNIDSSSLKGQSPASRHGHDNGLTELPLSRAEKISHEVVSARIASGSRSNVANASHARERNDAPAAMPQVWYQEAWIESETDQMAAPATHPPVAEALPNDDFVTDEEIQMTSVRSSHLSPAAIEAIQRVETLKAAMEKLSNRIDQYKFTESNHSFQVRDKSQEPNRSSVEAARVVTENYRASQAQLRQEAKAPETTSHDEKPVADSSRSNVPLVDRHEAAPRFQAVWEVDRFYWPDVTAALSQDPDFDLASIGKNLVRAHQTGLRTILITSLERGEGRSTVAMCVARCASRAGLKVALLDGDLSNPALVDHLNLDVTHPWTDTIFEDLRLEDAAIHSIQDQITFLPSGKDVDDRQLRKHQNRIVAMLQSLAHGFDLVVVDGDPISSLGFTLLDLAAAHAFDSAVMVIDQRERPMRELEDAVKQIRQRGIQSVGIVENFR